MTKLSIIIPCYNEEKRIEEGLDKISKYFKKRSKPEIIIVDDGSTDKTVELARKKGVKVISYPRNRGKGYAVKVGMMAAKGEWILFTDVDFSAPIRDLAKLERARGDIRIGSRNLKGSRVLIKQPWLRSTLGKTFPLLVNMLLLPGIKDSQCGFKLFSQKAARECFSMQKLKGFSFDVEVLYIARKKGFEISEVPVDWFNSTDSKVNTFIDSIKMFFDLFKIRVIHF